MHSHSSFPGANMGGKEKGASRRAMGHTPLRKTAVCMQAFPKPGLKDPSARKCTSNGHHNILIVFSKVYKPETITVDSSRENSYAIGACNLFVWLLFSFGMRDRLVWKCQLVAVQQTDGVNSTAFVVVVRRVEPREVYAPGRCPTEKPLYAGKEVPSLTL